jgi:2-oxoglutarate ferredoxin oxidoreductase subunit beta
VAIKFQLKDYKAETHPDWCPGCGDFGILNAIQSSLFELELDPNNVAIFSGIGCSGKSNHYLETYGIHTLHGRVLPFATGAKLANPHLAVIAVGGDGDGLGIGAGHFVAAGRRNLDLLYVFYDNEVYGLTKGQAAPTLALGDRPKSLPRPNVQSKLNPMLEAFAAGFTFIARSYAYNIKELKFLIQEGYNHPGLAFIDVLQPCPTYNNLHTKEWFGPRVYPVSQDGYDPVVPADLSEEDLSRKVGEFVSKATEWGEKIPTGIFWRHLSPTFEERVAAYTPGYPEIAPATRELIPGGRAAELMEEFAL